jgi:carbamoyl-phosphate synthase large subunit
MPEEVTALVTAVGGIGVGEQILKALLLAGQYRLVATDIDASCPQFALADAAEVLPPAGHPNYVFELFRVCKCHEVDVLFVGSEAELLVVSKVRQQFADAGILLAVNAPDTVMLCMDKNLTSAFLRANGFQVPRHLVVSTHQQVQEIDWYPVVVKPFRGGRGSRDCFIAQDPSQLNALLSYLAPERSMLMVQEYVGDEDSEYTVGVLHDLDGNFLNSIAVHRRLDLPLSIRQSVDNLTEHVELGPRLVISSGISQGTVGTYPEVTRTCEEIAQALGARGPINVQCRLVDGEVVVFEINPRFSGTTSLRALVGYNEPDILIQHHLYGAAIPKRFPYRPAMVLRSLREWATPEPDATVHRQTAPTRLSLVKSDLGLDQDRHGEVGGPHGGGPGLNQHPSPGL